MSAKQPDPQSRPAGNDAKVTGASPGIVLAREPDLDLAEFRRVLVESGLGATRPIDDRPRLEAMLRAADLIVTARREGTGELVGVARCLTDFTWCCYLSELAVSASAKGLGIGKAILDETRRQLGPQVSLNLFSMPDVVGFYDRAGMERFPDAFWYRRQQ
jgi:ribosomal protein S18 acetylase RimI-like enzyme